MDVPALTQCLSIALAGLAGAAAASRFRDVSLTPASIALAALVPALLALWLGPLPMSAGNLIWTVLLVSPLACLALIDAHTRTIPDMIAVPMIPVGLLHAWTTGAPYLLFGTASVGLILLALLASLALAGRASPIGGGDVLLFAGAMAWFGPGLIPDLVFITGLLLCGQVLTDSLRQPRAEAGPTFRSRVSEGIALAPSLGTAQIVVWFGGPLF